MSNPRTKKERSAAKDIRQGVIEQRLRSGNKPKKKAKPWKVLSLNPIFRGEGYFVTHRSATKEAAEAWIAKEQRSYPHRFLKIEGPQEP